MRRGIAPIIVVLLGLSTAVSGCGDDTPTQTRAEQAAIAQTDALLTSEGFGCRLLSPPLTSGAPVEARCVWVADTATERSLGLSGVTDPSLAGHDAMAFVFDGPTTSSFWMKDTLIPLTVAWVGADGRVLGTTDMTPCEGVGPCPTYAPPGPYSMAIEVAVGRAPALGLATGDVVELGDPCGPSAG